MVNNGGMSIPPLVETDGHSRVKRPSHADERTTVVAFLRWHRETLALKCVGLKPAQLAELSESLADRRCRCWGWCGTRRSLSASGSVG
jgi:hypothetical protein